MEIENEWLVGLMVDGMMGPGQQMAELESAIKFGATLSIEKDEPVYLSECKENEEIDYLVIGGRFFKQIEPIDVT